MQHAANVALTRRLLQKIAENTPQNAQTSQRSALVDSARYTSRERFDREQAMLFARNPQVVLHTNDLAESGACAAVEVAGISLIITRGDDGELRAFRNACRHRSTELLPAGSIVKKKALVCPYHGWTYDLAGNRIHVPHAECFAGKDAARDALSPAYVEARGGLVWASLAPFDATSHLGPIDEELRGMHLETHRVHKRAVRDVHANWKLIIDAFLDGYHIRHLHRDTVYRFFIDAASEAEPAGKHIRAATARRTLREAGDRALTAEETDARNFVTPSYVLFPSTVLIFHPDYVSVLTLSPLAADHTRFTHSMLVRRSAEDHDAHWDKSFTLIDEGVFAKEDLTIVESIQRGMKSSADETQLMGELEYAAIWFHAEVDRAIADPAQK